MSAALATVAHDPLNELLPKLEALLPGVAEVFGSIGVVASVSATDRTLDVFESCGATVARETAPDGVDTIGRRRRGCLEVALLSGASHLVYSDIDHVLRWLERDPQSLREAVAALPDADFTVFGRSAAVFARAPAPLRVTEAACSAFYERLTGRTWDLFMALRGMSAATARLIVEGCDEDTIATDVAWPLFVESQGGTVAYREVPVPYESHRWYVSGVSERTQIESDPRAWAFRFHLAEQMFEAFARWGSEAHEAAVHEETGEA